MYSIHRPKPNPDAVACVEIALQLRCNCAAVALYCSSALWRPTRYTKQPACGRVVQSYRTVDAVTNYRCRNGERVIPAAEPTLQS